MEDSKLTPEQIENWRNVLVGMVGPFALFMPDELIQEYRDNFQNRVDEEEFSVAIDNLFNKRIQAIFNAPVEEYIPPAKRKDMNPPTFMRKQTDDPTRKTAMELALEKANLKK